MRFLHIKFKCVERERSARRGDELICGFDIQNRRGKIGADAEVDVLDLSLGQVGVLGGVVKGHEGFSVA